MNFKSLREDKLKLSQEEFANSFDVDISRIKEWEVTNEPSMIVLQKIAEKTGMDFNTIMSYEKPKPKPFDAKNTWEKADFTKKSIIEYIKDTLEKMDVPEEQKYKYVDDLRDGIERNYVKPSISIVGLTLTHFDRHEELVLY
ncbi:helix-turn-helix transcriptional regulator [Clostridium sp. 001]|uniref:helix-turn-helix transcriptional regulator n=1 Tax=Clostridium sp. 001 TaxID=1970093 RepID=UPI001C2C8EB1|nr:helix-turn-helix transcriptional regulator [Clostridium sp. 001]QXE20955.1 hypothetical protein B5S50_20030 [Clostridium sp. 001]